MMWYLARLSDNALTVSARITDLFGKISTIEYRGETSFKKSCRDLSRILSTKSFDAPMFWNIHGTYCGSNFQFTVPESLTDCISLDAASMDLNSWACTLTSTEKIFSTKGILKARPSEICLSETWPPKIIPTPLDPGGTSDVDTIRRIPPKKAQTPI